MQNHVIYAEGAGAPGVTVEAAAKPGVGSMGRVGSCM